MEQTPQTLGERLAYARKAKNLSARALSIRAGLRAAAHVGLIERGTVKKPSGHTLGKLATALGVSIEWLLDGDGQAPTAEESGEEHASPKAAA